MPVSPYDDLPARAFWRTGVTSQPFTALDGLFTRKFEIGRSDGIMTAGSCFAQHIARRLRAMKFNVLDMEPVPASVPAEAAERFGYGIYSARYGNIYSARQLLQLLNEVRGKFTPEEWIWEKNGRFYDALRPSVEPEGLGSPAEVIEHRRYHLGRVVKLIRKADILIFTFGLTEAWEHRASGTVFPTAPGTIAGQFDPETFAFRNFTFNETYQDFMTVRKLLKRSRPDLKFVITVSPVPLTATASGNHVLPATVYSKSVLRAVAGQLASELDDVEYFPSYDLIASHASRGQFYEANLRSVSAEGVAAAMGQFVAQHGGGAQAATPGREAATPTVSAGANEPDADAAENDVVCEEMLLEAFAPKPA